MKRSRVLVMFGFLAVGPMAVMLACGDSTTGSSSGTPSATGTVTGQPTATGTGTSTSTSTPTTQPTSTGQPDSAVGRYCDLGFARGDALQGQVAFFDKQGAPLPSGKYRIRYVDGCMHYGAGQSFTVHAYEPSPDAAAYATWYTVRSDGGTEAFDGTRLPGIWIFGPDASTPDASDTYTSCVELSKQLPPTEFEYDAGLKLGVQLNDSPLGDNTIGPDGGTPTWQLERWSPSGSCP